MSEWLAIRTRPIRAFLAWLFRPRTIDVSPPPILAVEMPEPAATPQAEPEIVGYDHESVGEFHFKRAVLDRLPDYFKYLRRMQHRDPDAFALYSRIGASIVNYADVWFDERGKLVPEFGKPRCGAGDEVAARRELSPWWCKARPTFAAIMKATDVQVEGYRAMHKDGRTHDDRKKTVFPRFIYYHKFNAQMAPSYIQRVGAGDVYVVSVYIDDASDRRFKRGGVPGEFAVVVRPDNSVEVLRTLIRDRRPIRSTKYERGREFTIPTAEWKVEEWLVAWAKDNGNDDVNDFLCKMFVTLANEAEYLSYSMVRIFATKGGISAAFAIDIKRTPYFFKERDITVFTNGRRKPVFHIVRPHDRHYATGNVRTVKMHFRGERNFLWNGYRILITVPGLHHHRPEDFGGELISREFEDLYDGDLADMKHLGKVMRDHILGKPMA